MSKKIKKCTTDIYFITSCLQNNIMPNFTHFKTTNNRLRSQPIYKTCRKLLSTTELSNHKSYLYILNKSMKFIRNNKLFEISSDDLNSILHILDHRILNSFRSETKYKSVEKLNDLGIYVTLNDPNVNPILVTHRTHNKSNDISLSQAVYDLSEKLNNEELNLLNKGLKYGIQNRNFNHFEVLRSLKNLRKI